MCTGCSDWVGLRLEHRRGWKNVLVRINDAELLNYGAKGLEFIVETARMRIF